jgi:hypothetical protein
LINADFDFQIMGNFGNYGDFGNFNHPLSPSALSRIPVSRTTSRKPETGLAEAEAGLGDEKPRCSRRFSTDSAKKPALNAAKRLQERSARVIFETSDK